MAKKTHFFILLLLLFLPAATKGVDLSDEDFEDIYVFLRIERVGAYEISAIFSYETEKLYLPLMDLFRVLKINYEASDFYDQINGFFLDENLLYNIDYPSRQITLGRQTTNILSEDMLLTPSGLFVYHGILGPVFGLHTSFNFRSLSIVLRPDMELPAVRDLRLQQMRQNIARLRGEIVADTVLDRRYHLFRGGMVDWAVNASQLDGKHENLQLALGVGTEILFGEANVFLNYSSRDGFDERRQQYQWRWVNNNTRVVRQVRAGKINSGAISSIFAPLLGVSATNSPSTFRRSFGEYNISDFTNPGWTVELYVNNVLVDFQTADAQGFYSFDVPLVYGSSEIVLKFYGPFGEERSREELLNIPFFFVPQGELEYTVTSGIIQEGNNPVFGRAEVNYGLSRSMTLGGGYEYVSSQSSRSSDAIEIPFLSASASLFGRLLLRGQYAHDVRTQLMATYRFPLSILLELEYATFTEGQQAIRFSYLEERQARIAIPLRLSSFRGQLRVGFRQNVYQAFTYNTGQLMFSTSMGRVSGNISAFGTWTDGTTPYISSSLSLGVRLPWQMTFRPQAQFDVSAGNLVSIRADIEKRIGRQGHISLGYDENLLSNFRGASLNFRYDLPFAQTSVGNRVSSQAVNTSQGIRGSLALGSGNNYIHGDNRSAVGRGGISIIPFVDINHNGIYDKGEPLATGLNVRIDGGRTLRMVNDTIIRIVELEPFTSYTLQLDENSLENIAWRLTNKVKEVYIDPNQFKIIEIPVLPMGEASGTVYLAAEGRLRPLGRVLVNFYREDGTLLAQNMSEPDGYYVNMSVPPGTFYAMPDARQMQRMNLRVEPERIDFEVMADEWGDIVMGLDFVLHPIIPDVGELPDDVIPEDILPEDPRARIEAERQILSRRYADRINEAMRLLIHAQNAFLNKDYQASMDLVNRSLSIYITGQALALKGSVYYITGQTGAAQSYWSQAREMIPDLRIPDIDFLDRVIIRE